jgi:hypothetical protein
MRKLIIGCLLGFSVQSMAQTTINSAIITLKTEVKGLENMFQGGGAQVMGGGGGFRGMGGGDSVVYIRGHIAKGFRYTETESFVFMRTSLYDDSTKTTTVLMNRNGDKTGYVQTPADMEVAERRRGDTSWIEYTDSSKVIAKYKCKLAVINNMNRKGKILKTYIWYFPFAKLPFAYNFGQQGIEQIDGLPMEWERSLPIGDAKIITTIATLNLNPVIEDKYFIMNTADYKMMSFAQWQDQRRQQFGGFQQIRIGE